jgi:hypothetical protein
MSLFKRLLMIMAVVFLIAGVYGCEKEGPAEKAGKKLDQAMEDAKDKLDEATK